MSTKQTTVAAPVEAQAAAQADDPKVVARVLELRAKGLGFPAIAKELRLPARVSKGGRPDAGGRAYDIYHRNAAKVVKFQGTRVAATAKPVKAVKALAKAAPAPVPAAPAAETAIERKRRLDREYQAKKRAALKGAK